MTTTQLIDTLTRGAPVTSRLVREIITQLHALQWTRTALATTLERYANGRVTLEAEEAGWICVAMDDHERLKDAVAWLLDVEAAREWVRDECPWTTDDSWEEVERTYAETKNAVRNMI